MEQTTHPKLKHISWIIRLMDSQFRIPGTNFRFGLDPIMGLIPGFGDMGGLIVSAMILSSLAKNGASGFVLARMVLNIVIDSVIGSIPVLGDVFDFAFKANQRNLKLLEEHYVEGRHKGSALKVIVPILVLLFLFVALLGWLGYKLVRWIFA